MLTQKVTYLASLLFLVCCDAIAAQTQEDTLLLRDYHYVQQSDPWLTLRNAAGLTRYASRNIADAALSLTCGEGRLVNYYEAPEYLQVDAAVEAFQRISPRTVTFGSMSYGNWTGRDMTGSALMQHEQLMPFDIVEDSLTNAGRKHRDTYRLTGGFGTDLWRGYSIGLRLDYTSANEAKYKDLRHKNKLMNLQLTAGLYAPLLPWLSMGAHYTYHRQTESVSFATYGKNEKVYKSLIDYGALLGQVEQFGNEGYTDKSREMPLAENSHGGGLQIEVRPMSRLSLFAAANYSHGTGYYGSHSPYTITFTNHRRDLVTVNGRLSWAARTSRHCLDLTYSDEQLQNHAETYRQLTNSSGAYYYEYYDPTETADKRWTKFQADLTSHLGIRHERPSWTLTAGYHWQQRTVTAYLFPFYRHQALTSYELTAGVTRHIMMRQGVWTIGMNCGYRHGKGEPYRDGTFTTPAAGQPAPATMEAFLYQDYHLLTASQWRMDLHMKYAFRFPGTRLLTHVSGAFSHRKANILENDYCGEDHTTFTMALGCTF